MATVTLVWAENRDLELYLGEWSWVDDTIEVSLHGNAYEPSTTDLVQADLSDELSGTGYSRLTLTGKTYEVTDTYEALMTADESFWAGLNAGEARTAVLSLTTGEVLGYLPLRDSTGATDLTSTGGGGRITWRVAVAPPPPPPAGGWGATSASAGLGWGMNAPTSKKLTALELWAGATTTGRAVVVGGQTSQLALVSPVSGDVAVREDTNAVYVHNGGTSGTMADWTVQVGPPSVTARVYHSFVGGIEGPRSVQESAMANLVSTSHFTDGRGLIHLLTLRPLMKPARLKNADGTYAETQTQAYTRTGNTFSNVRAGGHDAHYREMGRIIAASGKDVRYSDGRPQLALQVGQEANLTSFPWYLGNDPSGFKHMFDRYVLCMRAGTTGVIDFDTWTISGTPNGIDITGVDIVFNVNTRGATTRANILSAFPDSATVFTMDWYDIQTGTQYSDGTITDADVDTVFAGRAGNSDTTKDTIVGGYWMLQVATDKDLYCGFDEVGLATTEVPPAEVFNVGGKDNPRYIDKKVAFLETVATSGRLAWWAYFEYDVSSTGMFHRITGGKYAHKLAEAKLRSLV